VNAELLDAALTLNPLVGIRGTVDRLMPLEPGLQATDYVRLSTLVKKVGWEVAKDLVPEVDRTLQRLERLIPEQTSYVSNVVSLEDYRAHTRKAPRAAAVGS
jgi:hypothetical protein